MYHMCQSCPKPIQCFNMVNGDKKGPSHNMKLLLLHYTTPLDCNAVKLLLPQQTRQVASKNSMCCRELYLLPWFCGPAHVHKVKCCFSMAVSACHMDDFKIHPTIYKKHSKILANRLMSDFFFLNKCRYCENP